MTLSSERWHRRRDQARASLPRPTVAICRLRRRLGAPGYEVTITGTDLATMGIPPSGTVGGVPLTDLRPVSATELRGTLDRAPGDDRVTVDLGPVAAEGRARLVHVRWEWCDLLGWLLRWLLGCARRILHPPSSP